jgi:hypothetical protein
MNRCFSWQFTLIVNIKLRRCVPKNGSNKEINPKAITLIIAIKMNSLYNHEKEGVVLFYLEY